MTLGEFWGQFVITPEVFSASSRKTRALIRDVRDELKGLIMATQADVQALADQLSDTGDRLTTGVQELRDEITRLADANPALDLTPLQDKLAPLSDLADQLGSDNVPAAPVEPPPVV